MVRIPRSRSRASHTVHNTHTWALTARRYTVHTRVSCHLVLYKKPARPGRGCFTISTATHFTMTSHQHSHRTPGAPAPLTPFADHLRLTSLYACANVCACPTRHGTGLVAVVTRRTGGAGGGGGAGVTRETCLYTTQRRAHDSAALTMVTVDGVDETLSPPPSVLTLPAWRSSSSIRLLQIVSSVIESSGRSL